jgi:antibiotic biosynthesis monooxygenase (ABM) superfamily enzyme
MRIVKNTKRCEQWHEFSRKFASPVNFYGWHESEKRHKLLAEEWRQFEKWHKLLAEGWHSWTCRQQKAPS